MSAAPEWVYEAFCSSADEPDPPPLAVAETAEALGARVWRLSRCRDSAICYAARRVGVARGERRALDDAELREFFAGFARRAEAASRGAARIVGDVARTLRGLGELLDSAAKYRDLRDVESAAERLRALADELEDAARG